jgi:hypothetical protein
VSPIHSVASAQPADWYPIGGPYASDPTVLPNTDAVFVVDEGGRPFYHQRNGTTWGQPIALDGRLVSVVAPAVPVFQQQQPHDFENFGVGLDGSLWHRTRTQPWSWLGGVLPSNPAAITVAGITHVVGASGRTSRSGT